ncbi:50S ribosomal protein L21 [uncultured Eudoraea sp.]|uniref:50S ribosomal protein L21 n=1 Tax=uncultured Eudoraea sp. TaxID=1035614 RepID=UPI0026198835|nr:50S ribosomal protein L21 [uncultured Eudoraea sp.]
MYAIVEIAGQQFKVAKDQKVYVHRLQEDEGKKVSFHNVLLLEDGNNITIGAPAIDGAAVEAKVVKHLKGDKVIVFKKKRRKGFQKKNGHRQYLTELVIEGIVAKGAKKTAAKTETKKEAPVKAAPVKKAAPKAEAPKAKVEKAKEAPKAKVEKAKVSPKAEVDLSKKTVAELKEMAKAKGISGISSMKKADLIEALNK